MSINLNNNFDEHGQSGIRLRDNSTQQGSKPVSTNTPTSQDFAGTVRYTVT